MGSSSGGGQKLSAHSFLGTAPNDFQCTDQSIMMQFLSDIHFDIGAVAMADEEMQKFLKVFQRQRRLMNQAEVKVKPMKFLILFDRWFPAEISNQDDGILANEDGIFPDNLLGLPSGQHVEGVSSQGAEDHREVTPENLCGWRFPAGIDDKDSKPARFFFLLEGRQVLDASCALNRDQV